MGCGIMDSKIESDLDKKELYNRLLPVLRSKIRELKLIGLVLTEEELFQVVDKELLEGIKIKELSINDLVTSIFNLDIRKIEEVISWI